jgi:hypothetical protein
MDYPNQQDKIRNTLVSAHGVPQELFADFEKNDIQENLDCHTVELIKEDLRGASVQ